MLDDDKTVIVVQMFIFKWGFPDFAFVIAKPPY